MFRDLRVNLLEFDEVWGYIGKKQKRLTPDDAREKGDAYTFMALDATRKAIISYRTGKRTADNTVEFAADVRARVLGRPQIGSDGFSPYVDAIEWAFGEEVDYGQVVKVYEGEPGPTAARRYSSGWVVDVRKTIIAGKPDRAKISTSYIERQNLSLRMSCRRFTRLTNAFSKKLVNHKAASRSTSRITIFAACTRRYGPRRQWRSASPITSGRLASWSGRSWRTSRYSGPGVAAVRAHPAAALRRTGEAPDLPGNPRRKKVSEPP